ncbi:hypothetical protein IMZ11_35490 [Microtetraspora sp. AC03309]|uniref:hypothetical protein n=1 Tax=Microtetraspora sp. AC03309 TaxID=2779376 RepID=UPI001E45DB11|nr:hypothetical protein [Microtetraspora sp. AC03309]MCC5580931.1 hypothetical protein [Microtetraspora sp. AC03309]
MLLLAVTVRRPSCGHRESIPGNKNNTLGLATELHPANLTSAPLTILDWEGIGSAPAGWDAATLHAYTLPVPEVAAQMRRVFADVLDTPAGRFAELAVAASILQAAEKLLSVIPYMVCHARKASSKRRAGSGESNRQDLWITSF